MPKDSKNHYYFALRMEAYGDQIINAVQVKWAHDGLLGPTDSRNSHFPFLSVEN